jgi:hypothetical protein
MPDPNIMGSLADQSTYDPATGMPYPGNAPDYGDLSQRMTNFEQRLPGHIASGIRDWIAVPGQAYGTVPGGPPTPEQEMDWSRGTALGQLGMARMPGMAGTGAVGAGGAKLVQPEGIFAYHSSPYTFDKFDMSKIGTGEGAQVYGHGIYAAENPAVSGQGGQYWQQFVPRFRGPEAEAAMTLQANKFDRDAAIAELRSRMDPARYRSREAYLDNIGEVTNSLKLLESGQPVGPRTYEVNINARPEQMLNWDAPLSQQPAGNLLPPQLLDSVQREAYSRALGSTSKARTDQLWGMVKDPMQAPGEFVVTANKYIRGPETSAMLNEAGIPGIRYLDQGSRPLSFDMQRAADLNAQVGKLQRWLAENPTDVAAQTKLAVLEKAASAYKPTSNYVIFDPSKIDIRKMYAVPGAVGAGAAGMGALATQDNYQPQ